MITSVFYQPAYLVGAYNPIIWSFFSDKILETDFKYVIDIYKDNVKILRLKQRPNPAGAGMVDLSTIAQGYLAVSDPNNPLVQGETTINYNVGQVFSTNGTMSAHFYLKVGEEYSVAGVTQIFNGITNAPGEPAYAIYSGKAGFANLPCHVWPSSVDYRRQQYAMSNFSTVSGAYGLDPIDNVIYDHGYAETVSRVAYPLMHNELEQDLFTFDKMVLSYINWSAFPASADNRPIYGFRYKFYNAAGTLVNTVDRPTLVVYGAGPRTTCTQVITNATLTPQYDLVHALASPEDLATAFAIALPAQGKIEITGHKRGSSCNFGAAITETVTINLLEYCEPLYPRVRLSWLNDLGGRDYMNFTMFTERTTSTTAAKYAQEEINWSSNVPVPQGFTTVPGNLATQGGDKVYNKQAMTSFKITTDWLSQEQTDLLEGLQMSPQVLAYIHYGDAFNNDFPYQVNVKQAAYTTKNVRQTKLVQATFDVEVTLSQKIQNQ